MQALYVIRHNNRDLLHQNLDLTKIELFVSKNKLSRFESDPQKILQECKLQNSVAVVTHRLDNSNSTLKKIMSDDLRFSVIDQTAQLEHFFMKPLKFGKEVDEWNLYEMRLLIAS